MRTVVGQHFLINPFLAVVYVYSVIWCMSDMKCKKKIATLFVLKVDKVYM